MNTQLTEYIQAALASGQSREIITQALAQNGWKAEDIAQGFAQVASPAPAYAAPMPAMASSTPVHSKLPWILGAVAMVAILAVGGGLVWANQQAKNTGVNAGSVSATASSSPTDDVSGGNGVADTPTDAFAVTVGSSAPVATKSKTPAASTTIIQSGNNFVLNPGVISVSSTELGSSVEISDNKSGLRTFVVGNAGNKLVNAKIGQVMTFEGSNVIPFGYSGIVQSVHTSKINDMSTTTIVFSPADISDVFQSLHVDIDTSK